MSIDELASIGVTPESIEIAINGSHKGWLFEEEGEVGGFAMGNSENAELTVMAMLPAHEGKGVGGKLLRSVESWLQTKGCERIWLTTDVDPELRAYGFYLSQGWENWKIEHGLRFMSKVLG